MSKRLPLQVEQGLQDVPCPCGGTFTVCHTAQREPAITHTLPPCDDFVQRDLADFMHWINVQRGNYA